MVRQELAALVAFGGCDDAAADFDQAAARRIAERQIRQVELADAAPLLWNHLGFDRAAMQDRQEGSVVVEMLNHYRRPLRAGDLLVVMSGLAAFTDKVLTFTHFLFEAETATLAACAEAVGMKLDQKIRKTMTFTKEDQTRLAERQLHLVA